MKVSWPRQVTQQLRFPQICAVTGQPATSVLPTLFRNRMSYWLPGVGRLIMTLSNPPIMVGVPVSPPVRQQATSWRLIGLFGPLAGVVLAVICAVAIGDTPGSLLFFVLLVASLAFAIFARMRADVFGANVDGDAISMSNAHPAFVDALLRSNPPGLIQVEGSAAVGPAQGRPQAQGYAQPTYPQQAHPQAGYPQQTYPQQTYPQQTYPQPGSPDGHRTMPDARG